MNDFVNKWFPPQKPNLVAKYKSDFIPPSYAYKKSMDRLKEIDRKLDLLHEYLAYRTNWMSNYGSVASKHRLVNTGMIFINYGDLMSFDDYYKLQQHKMNVFFAHRETRGL